MAAREDDACAWRVEVDGRTERAPDLGERNSEMAAVDCGRPNKGGRGDEEGEAAQGEAAQGEAAQVVEELGLGQSLVRRLL
jgi:hypothetical protein